MKVQASNRIAVLAEMMMLDGAISIAQSHGHSEIDFFMTISKLEENGVKCVGICMESPGHDGSAQPKLFLDSRSDALVSTGSDHTVLQLPAMEHIIGSLESIGRDAYPGAWTYDAALGPSLHADGSLTVDALMICGQDGTLGWSNKTCIEDPSAKGIRRQILLPEGQTAAKRAMAMLFKKLSGFPPESEIPITRAKPVPIAPPLHDPSKARIAFLSTGGLVPVQNPDHLPGSGSTHFGRYPLLGCNTLKTGEWKCVSIGMDQSYANAEPMLMMPLDALRRLEHEHRIGCLHPWFYTTTGTQTDRKHAVNIAKGILKYLKEDHVDGVILGSCCGTCTRCGAIIARVIEAEGLPVVHVVNMTAISRSIGVNRILKAYSIPSPMADADTAPPLQRRQRYELMEKALAALSTDIKSPTIF